MKWPEWADPEWESSLVVARGVGHLLNDCFLICPKGTFASDGVHRVFIFASRCFCIAFISQAIPFTGYPLTVHSTFTLLTVRKDRLINEQLLVRVVGFLSSAVLKAGGKV